MQKQRGKKTCLCRKKPVLGGQFRRAAHKFRLPARRAGEAGPARARPLQQPGTGVCQQPGIQIENRNLMPHPDMGLPLRGGPAIEGAGWFIHRLLCPAGPLRGAVSGSPCIITVSPPAKPWACVSPERASYRQASQEALKKSAACITCPAARKWAPFVQDYLSGNRKVVHLFPLRSMLEAKAFLFSPADLGVVISLKHTKQGGPAGRTAGGAAYFCILPYSHHHGGAACRYH